MATTSRVATWARRRPGRDGDEEFAETLPGYRDVVIAGIRRTIRAWAGAR